MDDRLLRLNSMGIHCEEDAKGYRLKRGSDWTWVSVADLMSCDDVATLAEELFWMPESASTGKLLVMRDLEGEGSARGDHRTGKTRGQTP